ncbi:MAG TPA: hypothetical protein VGA85_04000 [Dehalococcoidales bacterium]
MKRKALIALALLVVATLLVGCGGVSQEDLDAAVAAKDTALAQVASIQSDLTTAQSSLTAATAAKTKAEADLATAQASLTKANSDLTASKAQVTTLTAQVATLTTKVADLEKEVAALKAAAAPPVTPPVTPPAGFTGTKYTDSTYGFSFKYPTDWTEGATLPQHVIKIFGAAPYTLPRVVVIVEDQAANATLEAAFKAYVTANSYTFKSYGTPTSVTIGGVACTKVDGVYTTAYGDANGKMVGFAKNNKWVIILVITVDALGAWPNATQQVDIINSITIP